MMSIHESTNKTIEQMTLASLRWYSVNRKINRKYWPSIITSFASTIDGDIVTCHVYGSSQENAEDQVDQYIGKHIHE